MGEIYCLHTDLLR